MKDQDLNLLKALNALIASESITRMGAHLGITQPAASRVMTRLRRAFADTLLVRTSKGYVLTPRALALKQSTQDALAIASQVAHLEVPGRTPEAAFVGAQQQPRTGRK